MFALTGKKKVCLICGYAKHIDVCHIRAVADFPQTATMSEINNPDNLIALCPNHHVEFDTDLTFRAIIMRKTQGS